MTDCYTRAFFFFSNFHVCLIWKESMIFFLPNNLRRYRNYNFSLTRFGFVRLYVVMVVLVKKYFNRASFGISFSFCPLISSRQINDTICIFVIYIWKSMPNISLYIYTNKPILNVSYFHPFLINLIDSTYLYILFCLFSRYFSLVTVSYLMGCRLACIEKEDSRWFRDVFSCALSMFHDSDVSGGKFNQWIRYWKELFF